MADHINLAEKWRAFGWNVREVDGHDHAKLRQVLDEVDENMPTCIIANTIKGKGVSFMEDNLIWHYRDPQGEDYVRALQEVEEL